MMNSGYNPLEMIGVMKILKDAAGPNRTPEFQSTHPDPDNRIEKIQEAIREYSQQQKTSFKKSQTKFINFFLKNSEIS